uniref:Serpentine receptor class gamma n=1 Tax=Caenorhabditis tropicalis TaxID=1561998 RepID=A0A1I7UBF1_9PELO
MDEKADSYVVNMENGTIDGPALWLARAQLTYGIPSFCLLLYMIGLVAFGKRYKNSSFYKLVLFDLITNFFVYVNTWIAIRLEIHPSLVFILKFIQMVTPGVLTILKYLPYWFFHMHFWTAALLTLHRLTSILFPHQYERKWNIFFPLIVIGVGVISHLPKLIWTGFLYEVYIKDGILICINFPHTLDKAINVVAAFSVIYFGLNFVNGILTAYFASTKIDVASNTKTNITKKLTKIALVYSVCYSFEVLWSVLNSANSFFHFMPPWWAGINNSILVIASDTFTLFLPYVLLAFDVNVQRDVGFRKARVDSNHGTLVIVSAAVA